MIFSEKSETPNLTDYLKAKPDSVVYYGDKKSTASWRLLYFIALFALHVLCNIQTAMKNIPTNQFLITGYQGPDYFCDRENA